MPGHFVSVPIPGAHGVSPVELLVIQRDVVVHVALSMVCEDLIFTKTLQGNAYMQQLNIGQ